MVTEILHHSPLPASPTQNLSSGLITYRPLKWTETLNRQAFSRLETTLFISLQINLQAVVGNGARSEVRPLSKVRGALDTGV